MRTKLNSISTLPSRQSPAFCHERHRQVGDMVQYDEPITLGGPAAALQQLADVWSRMFLLFDCQEASRSKKPVTTVCQEIGRSPGSYLHAVMVEEQIDKFQCQVLSTVLVLYNLSF